MSGNKNQEKQGNSSIKGLAGAFGNSLGKPLSKVGKDALKKAEEAVGEAGIDTLKRLEDAAVQSGTKAMEKITTAVGEKGAVLANKAGDLAGSTGEAAQKILDELNKQKEQIEKDGFSETAIATTRQLIIKTAGLPIVRVNREGFLRETFGRSKYIEEIIKLGPPAVFTKEALREKADELIANSTRKTATASFVAGLPSNIVLMTAAGAADIAQFFAFALNLAQKIAYLFGEDDIFTDSAQVALAIAGQDDLKLKDGTTVPEEAQVRLISYLGAMMGVTGAGTLILKTSQRAGASIGKKVASQALTKTAWYPLLKKTASMLGYKVTKKSVESIISKAVPVIGGAISGGITYVTFKPMGGKLADEFVKILNGDYDRELELNPEFLAQLLANESIEADFEEIEKKEDLIIE